MPDTQLMTGRDLGQAICKHFGLDPNQVQPDFCVKNELDGLASITLTVALSPADLAGVARCADALADEHDPESLQLSASASEILKRYGVGAQGKQLFAEPDPRLDEIVKLLRQIVANQTSGVQAVAQVCPGE